MFLLPGAKKQPAPRARRKPEEQQLPLGGDLWKASDLAHDTSAGGEFAEQEFVLEPEDDFVLESADETEASEDENEITLDGEGDESWFEESSAADSPDDPDGPEADDESDESEASNSSDSSDAAASEPEPEPEAEPEPAPEPPPPPRAAPRSRRKAAPPPPPPVASSVTPWLGFAALVLAAYLGATWMLLTRPALADRVLGAFPAFADLQAEAVLARSVHLDALEANYQLIGDRETAFVISGYATSTATQPVRDVQVRGSLLDAEGQVLDEKSVYCGAATTPPVLSDLDTREVTVLQRIKPPDRFAIGPGADARFLIAFVDPPEGVARYTVEVISAASVPR